MIKFTSISDDQLMVTDMNDHQMGHLIRDSVGIWIYFTEKRSLILTITELEIIIAKLKELNK